MNDIEQLKTSYIGDRAWLDFCKGFPEIGQLPNYLAGIRPDIARVLVYKLGNSERVATWLERPLPALAGERPIAILGLQDGEIILRSLIMRMPD